MAVGDRVPGGRIVAEVYTDAEGYEVPAGSPAVAAIEVTVERDNGELERTYAVVGR